jgi:hypothetical protein
MKLINWYGERHDGSLIYAESQHEMLVLIEKGFDMKPLYELELSEITLLQSIELRKAQEK